MMAGGGKSSRGGKFTNRLTSESISVSRVPRDLRQGGSPQVAAEEARRGRWTLTRDRTEAKDAASEMLDRRELHARTGTVAGLGRSVGLPPAWLRIAGRWRLLAEAGSDSERISAGCAARRPRATDNGARLNGLRPDREDAVASRCPVSPDRETGGLEDIVRRPGVESRPPRPRTPRQRPGRSLRDLAPA